MKRIYPSGASKRKKITKQKEDINSIPGISSFFLSKDSGNSNACYKPADAAQKLEENLVENTGVDLKNKSGGNSYLTKSKEANNISFDKAIYSTDPAKWTIIDDKLRSYWISKGPAACQHKDADFSKSVRSYQETDGKIKSRCFNRDAFDRKLRNGESVNREWLIYSPSTCSIYCFMCRLFSHSKSSFSSQGFKDWKHSTTRIVEHENGTEHRSCVLQYLSRINSKTVDSCIARQFVEERQYWEEVLKRIVAVVKFLASRGLAFRGKNQTLGSPQNGNFLGILELLGEFNPFLKEHISSRGNKGKGVPSYLSSSICEEFIAIMGRKVQEKIVEEVKRAKYYSLSVDSTPDIRHVDQLTFTIRYVKENAPVERFLEFIPIFNHRSTHLSNEILNFLQEKGIPIEDCRGQSYDNASNMAGKYAGVQANILAINKNAIFVPCAGHSLNLIGVHAVSSCPDAIRFFEFVQYLYNFFSSSAHRWNVFLQHTKSTVIKRLSDTRWSAHYDAVKALFDGRKNIEKALDDFITDPDQSAETKLQASHFYKKIGELETVFLIYLWHDILQRFNSCSKMVQQENINLQVVVNVFGSLRSFIQQMRDQFEFYEEKAKRELPNIDYIDTTKRVPQRSSRIKFHESKEGEVILHGSDRFRVKTFLPIIDTVISEINNRAEVYGNINNSFNFFSELPKIEDTVLRQKCEELGKFYSTDIDGEELLLECQQIKHYLKSVTESNANSLSEIHSLIQKHKLQSVFPNIEIGLRIFLSMMVTNCTGERSFSKLKLIKTALRNSMSESRLNYLSLLSIEHELTQELDFSNVIKEFADTKSRKQNI